MILRTLRSLIPKQSIPFVGLSIKGKSYNLLAQSVYIQRQTFSYNFSTSTKQDQKQQHQNEEIESLLSELESESLENFEEPFVRRAYWEGLN